MSSCAWPYPWNWTKLNSCIYEYLTTYKKSTLYLNSFWGNSLILITFGIPKHAWPYSRKLAKWICCFYHFTPLLVREITDFRESSIILFGREFFLICYLPAPGLTWVIIEETASLIQCYSLCIDIFWTKDHQQLFGS